ncbi:MAG: DUF4190 domain-containing protein [Thermoguttaceae bacterium]|nr:DUF4190 domain-containing protein [Thermoguttaceae bacterium]MBR4753010.1 DUF4190 domain-containing protein [Thermoguttaceae bacterium]MBR5759052.1 DUF4190 domain-containing protein [Thermoguttaceae bacterium]
MKDVIFDDALKGGYTDIEVANQVEETVDYKQVATLGVESLVAAIFGILGFFWKPFIIASLLGLVLGILAKRKIMRAPDEISGGTLTTVALALSGVLFVTSIGWQAYSFYYSAPPGYAVLPFDNMALDKDGKVAEEILALDGHKVYIEGYMYPTKQHAGIENFTLVRTLGHCQFCSPGTNPADMIGVTMERGQTVKFRANKLVAVGGVLSVNPDFKDQPGMIPYTMKASVFR